MKITHDFGQKKIDTRSLPQRWTATGIMLMLLSGAMMYLGGCLPSSSVNIGNQKK